MGRRGPGAPNLTEQAWNLRLPDSPPFVQRKRWLTVERQSPRGRILGGHRGRSGLHSQAVAFSPRGSGLRTPLPSAARSLGWVISSLRGRERSNEHCPENAALLLLGAKLPPTLAASPISPPRLLWPRTGGKLSVFLPHGWQRRHSPQQALPLAGVPPPYLKACWLCRGPKGPPHCPPLACPLGPRPAAAPAEPPQELTQD